MDQFQKEKLQIQLVDTTSIYNKQINCNCFFDGYTLIYLGGAHIIYHNVFQKTKIVLERYSVNEAQAMAFHKSSTDLSIAIASNNPLCIVEFYSDGKRDGQVQLYEQLDIIDMKFIYKKKCCLLAYSKVEKLLSLCIVSLKKKIHKIQLLEAAHKLACNEQKVYILTEKGMLQFDIQTQSLHKQKKYENINVQDVLLLDHGKGLLFDSENNYYYFCQKQIIFKSNFSENFDRNIQYKSSIKVGRNILISFKHQFGISQYQFEDNKISFINHFQYSEKNKGNIIAMASFGDQLNLAIAFQSHYKEQHRIEHYLFNLSILSNQRKFISPFTRLVQGGLEHGEVLGLQLTIPSQVYYMSGPYVINYSYSQNIQKKHKYSIHENPRFISVHPLGHQILCVFQTSIKFYQKVEDQLIEIWSQAYMCNNARYTESGLLVLCIYQQGTYEVIIYDSNYFKIIHKFNNIYLKHSITRIDFDEDETQLILYSNKDMLIHKFKTGQKLSQFRQKRQVSEASCIEYDSIRKCILVASKNNILICRKNEQYCLNFNSQKIIQIGHEITCIHLNQYSQSIFMGTSDGQILHAEYPFLIEEQVIEDHKKLKIFYKSTKIHNNPVSNILVTLGGRYIFSSIKGQGLCILKIKYLTARKVGGHYNHFDISNYNFIETSSKSYLQNTQEKLKNLLQKRKTIFNELDQFKKQWQIKRITQISAITTKNKKKQLSEINSTLNEINRTKLQHQDILDQLSKFEKTIESSKINNLKDHQKELLNFYDQNDTLKSKLDQTKRKCFKEIEQLKEKCSFNLKEISEELQQKFKSFELNYNLMKTNLLKYKKRVDFQAQQNIKTHELEVQCAKQSLLKEEEELYKCNHEVKGQIARSKKQLQRFINRRDFLQNKIRFFAEQIKFCKLQEVELKDFKSELSDQLSNLENTTHKKQKILRKYFMENDTLAKYQFIHNKIEKQTQKELEFIQQQHTKLKQNIGELQKQILFISNERDEHQISLKSKKQKLVDLKQRLSRINQKKQFLQFQIRQLDYEIYKIDNNKEINEQSKNECYTKIYNKFFIEKQLEMIISNKQVKQNEVILQETKSNEKGVHNILVDHKKYLINNMGMLEQYNIRANQQITHSNLKYQNQNFNLIEQCRDKKEQITNKKRIMYGLVHQMQKTNKYISQIHSSSRIKDKKAENGGKKDIPFIVYEQEQEQQKTLFRKEKSDSSLWKLKQSTYQVRKMLEVQKLKSSDDKEPIRRIQTAKLKKNKNSNHQFFFEDSAQILNEFVYQGKPRTAATAGRRYHKKENLQAKRIFSRNKSNSKPTTCGTATYHGSKSKYSVVY